MKAMCTDEFTSYSTKVSWQNGGQKWPFFPARAACSFAAERLISGFILAIYAVSVSSDPRSKGHF
jgi:hypothetical protein